MMRFSDFHQHDSIFLLGEATFTGLGFGNLIARGCQYQITNSPFGNLFVFSLPPMSGEKPALEGEDGSVP